MISLTKGVWQHIAFTLNGNNGLYYVNGKKVIQDTTLSPRSILRTFNYFKKTKIVNNFFMMKKLKGNLNFIGRANVESVGYERANAELDDLKIFNKSLTDSEIMDVMNSFY